MNLELIAVFIVALAIFSGLIKLIIAIALFRIIRTFINDITKLNPWGDEK